VHWKRLLPPRLPPGPRSMLSISRAWDLNTRPNLSLWSKAARKSGLERDHGMLSLHCGQHLPAIRGVRSGLARETANQLHELQWADTGERLTAETFEKYRKQGGIVVIHSIPEEAARTAVADPIVMIASDGMPITGAKVHPRGQGTFSRVLGHYVREEKALD